MFSIVAVHGQAVGRGEQHRCSLLHNRSTKASSGALVGPIRGETGRSGRERGGGALSVGVTRQLAGMSFLVFARCALRKCNLFPRQAMRIEITQIKREVSSELPKFE